MKPIDTNEYLPWNVVIYTDQGILSSGFHSEREALIIAKEQEAAGRFVIVNEVRWVSKMPGSL